MGLRDLVLPTETIKVPGGGDFTVRGLSMIDVSAILKLHGAALETIYLERIVLGSEDPENFNMAALGRAVMQAAPLAMAQAIAQASGEPDQAKKVASLPLPFQVEAMERILALTFVSEEAAKNFLGTVIRGSDMVHRLLPELPDLEIYGPGREDSAAK